MMENKQIIVIHKNSFNNEPPTQAVVQTLSDLGYIVTLITLSINDYWKKELESRGVIYHSMEENSFISSTKNSIVYKLLVWIKYRFFVEKHLTKIGSDSLLWFVDADSVAPLFFSKIFNKNKYVFHILEMYDTSKFYKYVIKRYIKRAYSSVVCEEHRAAIFNVWFNPLKYPFVLPNKPYRLKNITEAGSFVKENYPELSKALLLGKKIILYQGIISNDRDLTPYIDAIKKLGNNYVLVLMGKDYGPLNQYIERFNNILYIPQIPSPQHLYITSVAHIGLLMYDPISLNQIFCAPNKIFEFGGYSVPMLGNNIPGLSILFDKYFAGEVCDSASIDSIVNTIYKIDDKYEKYRIGSKKLYDSIIVEETISSILK